METSVNMLRWVGRISPELYGNLCKYAEVGWPHITRPLWKPLSIWCNGLTTYHAIYYQTFMEIRVNMVGDFAGIICKYCKFGNFREGFIFAKLRICEVSRK